MVLGLEDGREAKGTVTAKGIVEGKVSYKSRANKDDFVSVAYKVVHNLELRRVGIGLVVRYRMRKEKSV